MRAGRWILLLLYLALVGGLFASALASGEDWAWIVIGVTLTASAVFILGAGHKDLFRPIGRPRILFPVVSASLMLTALFGGLTMALVELFDFEIEDDETWSIVAFWGSLLATWVFWGIILYVYTRKLPRYQAIYHMARFIFAGSIAELLATVPSHIIVSKRPGCLTGIVPLLLTRPWIMLAVFLAAFAGLIYSTEGEWGPLLIVMPVGLLGIVLLKLIMFDSRVLPAMPDDCDEAVD